MRTGSGSKRTLRAFRTPSGSVMMARCAENDSPDAVRAVTEPGFHWSETTGERSRMRAPACSACAGEMPGQRVVTAEGTGGFVAADLFFGLLLAGERGDADAACVGGVEAFDEGARLRRGFRAWLATREEFIEAHVAFAAREGGELVEESEGIIFRTGGELAVAEAGVDAVDLFERDMSIAEVAEKLGRMAVHELRAELDGRARFLWMKCEDAAADAVACFEEGDMPAGGGEVTRGGETGDACAEDEHVSRSFQSRVLRSRCFARFGCRNRARGIGCFHPSLRSRWRTHI